MVETPTRCHVAFFWREDVDCEVKVEVVRVLMHFDGSSHTVEWWVWTAKENVRCVREILRVLWRASALGPFCRTHTSTHVRMWMVILSFRQACSSVHPKAACFQKDEHLAAFHLGTAAILFCCMYLVGWLKWFVALLGHFVDCEIDC